MGYQSKYDGKCYHLIPKKNISANNKYFIYVKGSEEDGIYPRLKTVAIELTKEGRVVSESSMSEYRLELYFCITEISKEWFDLEIKNTVESFLEIKNA